MRVLSVCGLEEAIFSPSLFLEVHKIRASALSDVLVRSIHPSSRPHLFLSTGEQWFICLTCWRVRYSLIHISPVVRVNMVSHCTHIGGLPLVPLTWASWLNKMRICYCSGGLTIQVNPNINLEKNIRKSNRPHSIFICQSRFTYKKVDNIIFGFLCLVLNQLPFWGAKDLINCLKPNIWRLFVSFRNTELGIYSGRLTVVVLFSFHV